MVLNPLAVERPFRRGRLGPPEELGPELQSHQELCQHPQRGSHFWGKVIFSVPWKLELTGGAKGDFLFFRNFPYDFFLSKVQSNIVMSEIMQRRVDSRSADSPTASSLFLPHWSPVWPGGSCSSLPSSAGPSGKSVARLGPEDGPWALLCLCFLEPTFLSGLLHTSACCSHLSLQSCLE